MVGFHPSFRSKSSSVARMSDKETEAGKYDWGGLRSFSRRFHKYGNELDGALCVILRRGGVGQTKKMEAFSATINESYNM